MLIRTDYCKKAQRAKITLQCELMPNYYNTQYVTTTEEKIELGLVADRLYDVDRELSDEITMTLSTVVPVGFTGRPKEWLVVELISTDPKYEDDLDWEELVFQTTVRILDRVFGCLTDDHIATVEIGESRFVVMDDV